MSNKYTNRHNQTPLEDNIVEMLKVVCYSVMYADERGIPRSELDVVGMMKFARNERVDIKEDSE